MKYHELTKGTGAKSKQRKGRGIAAGRGKTAGRGTKGQNARKSGGVRLGFEGGQTPLFQRIPKTKGFKSFRKQPQIVYSGDLNQLKGATADNKSLEDSKLIADQFEPVKIIRKGDKITKKLSVKTQFVSQSVIDEISKAGGNFQVTELAKRQKTTATKEKPKK